MAVALHPQLTVGPLAGLLGEWEGEGRGHLPGRTDFEYVEHDTFTHNGKPFLIYSHRTRASDDGRPLHGETGFWRVTETGEIEVVLAHGIGVTEVALGRWDGPILRLRTAGVQRTPTAKHVTELARELELDGDTLSYRLHMTLEGAASFLHLEATLRRTG